MLQPSYELMNSVCPLLTINVLTPLQLFPVGCQVFKAHLGHSIHQRQPTPILVAAGHVLEQRDERFPNAIQEATRYKSFTEVWLIKKLGKGAEVAQECLYNPPWRPLCHPRRCAIYVRRLETKLNLASGSQRCCEDVLQKPLHLDDQVLALLLEVLVLHHLCGVGSDDNL